MKNLQELAAKHLAKSSRTVYNMPNKSETPTPTGEIVMREAYTTYLDDSNHRWGASKAIIDGHKLVGVCGTNNVMERYLYELNDYDKQELYANKVVLKKDEAVFRFSNRTVEMGGLFPLVKINTKKGLLYFLTDAIMSGEKEEIEFKTKGEKLAWFRTTDRKLTLN